MRIGIPVETSPGETRVAATPETVKKFIAGGRHSVMVQRAAGRDASIPDSEFTAAGATLGCATDVYSQSDVVLKVQRPEAIGASAAAARQRPRRAPLAARRPVGAGQHRRDGVRDGTAPSHHARAEHGRAVVAGQHRGLQGGDRRRARVRPVHADAHDRGRHGEGRARARPRRRRRGASGDRHGQAPGCRHRGL